MDALRWFYTFFRRKFKALILGLVLIVALAALAIVNPYIAGVIVDNVIYDEQYNLLPVLVAVLVGVTVTIGGIRFCIQLIFETISQGVLYDIRHAVYVKLLNEDFAFYNKKKTGDLMSRQTGDIEAVRGFLAGTIYSSFYNLLLFLFALSMVFTINFKLACCMLIVLPFTALTTVRQMKKVRPAFQRNRECYASLNAFTQENISANRVIKAFATEEYEVEKFEKENDKFKNAMVDASKVWRNFVPVFEILAEALRVILMGVGGYMTIIGEISIGELVQVNGYLWMLNNPLRIFSWKLNEIQSFITSIEKIYATYQEEPDVKNPFNRKRTTPIKGEIEFKNVSYKMDDEVVVKDINFKVKAGQTIGIIGSTGSGKSTLMNLLCRFYDTTSGEVLVDGQNVKNHNLFNLRDHIGMAMQDVFLFSDTIEGNIAYGRPNCTFEAVKEAAIMADANHFIKGLSEGYDTIIGERGVGLSGGQKQRISLARALLKNPSILILDDTTSAVDMETESYIQTQLQKINADCTTFVIAYRISSIKSADLILVMDHGKIIEQGTHDSLLGANGYYAQAFKNQYGEVPYELLNEKKASDGGNK